MNAADFIPKGRRKYRALVNRIKGLPVEVGYYRGPWVMSRIRMRWVLLRNPHATIRFGKHNFLGPGFSLHMPHGGTFITGDYVEFRRNFRAELGPTARIEIRSETRLTYDVIFQCDTTITVGERCAIGQCTMVVDGSHRFKDLSTPFLEQGYDYRPITIGDDALVLSKCTIVNNIGERSVIAANAVVSRPIPAFCLAAGVPARVIDYFGPAESAPDDLSELT